MSLVSPRGTLSDSRISVHVCFTRFNAIRAHRTITARATRNTQRAETRNTQPTRNTQKTRYRDTQKTRNTQRAKRVTNYEFRVSCTSASWRSAKSSPWTDSGWLAGWLAGCLMGAMEAGRRIRRVRFCMHLYMATDSVMKQNFAFPGSYLEP